MGLDPPGAGGATSVRPVNRLLVTGFEPFGGLMRNPSQAVVEALPDALPSGASLVRRVLPVDRVTGPRAALDAIAAAEHVDAVLALGVAVGTPAVQVERVFINHCEDGTYTGRLVEQAADGHFSGLPIQALVEAGIGAGVPTVVSNSAGTYVCNALGFTLRQQLPGLPSGFVHLPMTPGDDVPPGTPTLPIEQELGAVTAMLIALDGWLRGS